MPQELGRLAAACIALQHLHRDVRADDAEARLALRDLVTEPVDKCPQLGLAGQAHAPGDVRADALPLVRATQLICIAPVELGPQARAVLGAPLLHKCLLGAGV